MSWLLAPSLPRTELPRLLHPRVEGRLFRELLIEGCCASGLFEDLLREAGCDLRQLQPDYPTRFLPGLLDLARQLMHPDLTRAQGLRQLGRVLALASLSAPRVRWALLLARLSGRERSVGLLWELLGRYLPSAGLEVIRDERDRLALWVAEPDLVAEFWAGAMEVWLARAGQPSAVEVTAETTCGSELAIAFARAG